jgi:hypothetical protein
MDCADHDASPVGVPEPRATRLPVETTALEAYRIGVETPRIVPEGRSQRNTDALRAVFVFEGSLSARETEMTDVNRSN